MLLEAGSWRLAARRRYNPPVAAFFCYIVECADGTFYTGWTTDPERRLRQHAAGRGARYTRAHRPLRLVFVEPQANRGDAMRREHALKAMTRARKQMLISNFSGDEEAIL
jgi:putative endonuclease